MHEERRTNSRKDKQDADIEIVANEKDNIIYFAGELAAQNIPQNFYCRVVPKYNENYGSTKVPYKYKYEVGRNFAENKEKIQSNQDKIIA
ncbi:hypothetical protein G9A89_016463 [Geosiphon pyriformis]|nr:hypothetical protein G9A89_016463 [Geosiphon pyriformis]